MEKVQTPDILICNSKEYPLFVFPYLPKNSDFIIEDKSLAIDSVRCTREYKGTWEIQAGKLYLKSLKGCYTKTSEDLLFADWFSGVLKIGKGDGFSNGHRTKYEFEINLSVKQGILMDGDLIDNSEDSMIEAGKLLKSLGGGNCLGI